mmetsp:Transcript_4508/g.7808  ORF Transcript_4508/g.7808 Transcript_4508/m.7808 type:complete len:231 (+) Transcript_4508:325-1017(+)
MSFRTVCPPTMRWHRNVESCCRTKSMPRRSNTSCWVPIPLRRPSFLSVDNGVTSMGATTITTNPGWVRVVMAWHSALPKSRMTICPMLPNSSRPFASVSPTMKPSRRVSTASTPSSPTLLYWSFMTSSVPIPDDPKPDRPIVPGSTYTPPTSICKPYTATTSKPPNPSAASKTGNSNPVPLPTIGWTGWRFVIASSSCLPSITTTFVISSWRNIPTSSRMTTKRPSKRPV